MDSRENLWVYDTLIFGCAFPFSSCTQSKFESGTLSVKKTDEIEKQWLVDQKVVKSKI